MFLGNLINLCLVQTENLIVGIYGRQTVGTSIDRRQMAAWIKYAIIRNGSILRQCNFILKSNYCSFMLCVHTCMLACVRVCVYVKSRTNLEFHMNCVWN